jgi:hypothetical protein
VKSDVHRGRTQWPDVDDLDLAEDGYMSNETVDPRSDVNVPIRRGFVDSARDVEVLVEVVTAG